MSSDITYDQILHAVFKSSSDGIWVCDGQGRVISINEASERLNGISASDVVGRNVAELVADKMFDQSVTLKVLASGKEVSMMQYAHRTGRHLLVTGTPSLDEDNRINLVVVNERDMTDLNALREELEKSHMVTEKIKEELTELSMLELTNQSIVAESKPMRQILRTALKLASFEASNILITGESGTGKGLLAKFIHQSSRRKKNPFIQINCATLPKNLLEAELFGYEQGAFTGAREHGKAGLFELAHEGTLFLDEIGELPIPLQSKLLKYLDDNEVMRLGGTKSRKIDCLVQAATNHNLEEMVKERTFRNDLYYRLNTFSLRIPPLRERPEDVFELVRHYLEKYNRAYGLRKNIRSEALNLLQVYPFPGNVRELKNIIKKATVMSERRNLDEFISGCLKTSCGIFEQDGGKQNSKKSLPRELAAVESKMLKSAMSQCNNTRQMAVALGISQSTVVRKMKKHGLRIS